MVEMVDGVKLMKCKTGLQLVHALQLMLFGIMVPRICTELVLKAWLVLYVVNYNFNMKIHILAYIFLCTGGFKSCQRRKRTNGIQRSFAIIG